jgi:hypothetical protein
VKESGLQEEIMRMLDEADMWDHLVEVNAGNAEQIRNHPKTKLLPYKGWAPEGKYENDPAAIANQLQREGVMIFTKDPRPVCKYLKREGKQVPLPTGIRAWWTSQGIHLPGE